MEIIQITPEALNSFRMLMRLIRGLDDKHPGCALVKDQAEAVEEMMDPKQNQQMEEEIDA